MPAVKLAKWSFRSLSHVKDAARHDVLTDEQGRSGGGENHINVKYLR